MKSRSNLVCEQCSPSNVVKFREWRVQKCVCNVGCDWRTTVKGQKTFFTKHNGLLYRHLENVTHFHTSMSKETVCYCKNVLKIIARYSPYFRQHHFPTDGAPAYRWRHVTQLLNLHSHDVLEFIEPKNCPPNSPDFNPVISCCGELCSRSSIIKRSETSIILSAFH